MEPTTPRNQDTTLPAQVTRSSLRNHPRRVSYFNQDSEAVEHSRRFSRNLFHDRIVEEDKEPKTRRRSSIMSDSHSKPLTFDFRDQFPPDFDATPLAGTANPSGFQRCSNAIIGILSETDARGARIPRGAAQSASRPPAMLRQGQLAWEERAALAACKGVLAWPKATNLLARRLARRGRRKGSLGLPEVPWQRHLACQQPPGLGAGRRGWQAQGNWWQLLLARHAW